MNKWTPEQEEAINKDGTNIIVSAGAGSGKTMVLTARVIRKLKEGVNINELLILTFTNKAANEMKNRIRKAISEDKDVIDQLDYIDSSYITTFDSFALSIVKKYNYLLNIGSNVKVAESSTIYLEKVRILDDIFDRLYNEKNEKFFKLIGDLTIKKDDPIKEFILKINNKLDLKYDKIDSLNNFINNNYTEENIKFLIDSYTDLLKRRINDLKESINVFGNMVDTEYFSNYYSCFEPLFESDTYLEIRNNSRIIKAPQLRGSSEEAKDLKNNIIKKDLDKIIDLTRYEGTDELKDIFISTKEYNEIIVDIIKELDERLNEFKNNLNIYEFNDISKMAIKVVRDYPVVREELKNSFKEIMVDEYQDTSDLQEEFISYIQNNNVYMVGDIKQSIYRFRNANPYLFKNKYDSYSKNIDGYKIDLTKNFRSRDEVIKNINTIFSSIMNDRLGGADYVKSHQMIAWNEDYTKLGNNNYNNNFELYNYPYDKDSKYDREEIEIFFIVQDIKNKVENKYQVYDRDLKSLRDVTYKDFAILLSTGTLFDLYKNIFEYFGIPITKYNATDITGEIEISLFKNILKLLINRRDNNLDVEFKYAFVSILRSYLFRETDQVIFDCVTNNNYDGSLINILDRIIENIDSLSLNEIIYMIVDEFDFYNKIILVGDVVNRSNRITSIINIFNSLSEMGYTIDDAYNYLNEIIDGDNKIEVKELDTFEDSVTLMTIHGSKGLEFPICYFASLHNEFNIRDVNDRILYNDKYGIVCPYYKEGIGNTFVKDLVRDEYIREEISEKIRLFYVALTRAKEKFIIVTSLPDKPTLTLSKTNKLLDFINYIKDDLSSYIKELDIESLNINRDYNLIKKTNYKNSINKSNELIEFKNINIENSLLHKEKISKETHELIDKSTKDKMRFGTLIHEVLELIDFNNPDLDSLELDDYYKDKIKKFISLIDLDNIVNTYKEYEFLYEDDGSIYHGIIDLLLEYPDKYMIIDYKLKNTNDDNYVKQLESYKKYIGLKTNKPIDIYLFSIIDGTFDKLS